MSRITRKERLSNRSINSIESIKPQIILNAMELVKVEHELERLVKELTEESSEKRDRVLETLVRVKSVRSFLDTEFADLAGSDMRKEVIK